MFIVPTSTLPIRNGPTIAPPETGGTGPTSPDELTFALAVEPGSRTSDPHKAIARAGRALRSRRRRCGEDKCQWYRSHPDMCHLRSWPADTITPLVRHSQQTFLASRCAHPSICHELLLRRPSRIRLRPSRFRILPPNVRSTGQELHRLENVGLPAVVAISRSTDKSSEGNVPKPVSQIKMPSNVVSDTARPGLAATLHSRDAPRRRQPRGV
jgi:hypothetical protein